MSPRRYGIAAVLAIVLTLIFTAGAGAVVIPGSAVSRSNVAGLTNAQYMNSFVTRDGSQLQVAGQPFRYAGANIEYLGLMNYGPDASKTIPLGSEAYPSLYEIDDALATAHEMGDSVVRVQTLGDTVGCALCEEPSAGTFNAKAFAETDLLIAQARRYGIKLIGEFDGDANGSEPPGQVGSTFESHNWYCQWAKVTADCGLAFFTDKAIITDYEQHMAAVLNHVNPYTGLAYKDDPTIAGWVDGNNLDLTDGVPPTLVENWISQVSAYFKSIDTKQLYIDNSLLGGDAEVTPTALAIPGVDVYSQEYYPHWFPGVDGDRVDGTAVLLHTEAAQVADAHKAYVVLEYGWDNTNFLSQSALSQFLTLLNGDKNVSGYAFWALVGHADGHGWLPIPANGGCSPTCEELEDGNWWALYYTGVTTLSNTATDMAQRAQIIRSADYGMDGFSAVPPHETAPAPIITSVAGPKLLFEGSAGASAYSVEKFAGHGHWHTLCHLCTTAADGSWQDPSGTGGCYRVIAWNLSEVAGPASAPAGSGCPTAKHARLAPKPTAPAAPEPSCTSTHWVGSWYAAPSDASVEQPLADQTLRMIIAPHLAGTVARIHLSNRFGTTPVTLGPVTIGDEGTGAALVPGTLHTVTFNGLPTVTIPAGGEVISDPVAMTVKPFVDLAISVYVPGAVATPTEHFLTRQTNYLSATESGDHAGDVSGASFTQTATKAFFNGWYFLDGLDVSASARTGSVVVFGDSIDDGAQVDGSLPDNPITASQNDRWPDFLQRRLDSAGIPLSVLNSGISGNRLVSNGEIPEYGPSGVSRFQMDALALSGVSDVILFEGLNDFGQEPGTTAQQEIDGYQQLIAEAHAAGIKIQLGTLTPDAANTGGLYGTQYAQAARTTINHWIETQHLSDGYIDFAAAVADPSDPSVQAPQYDDGDHLHYTPAGYQALAGAVPLNLLARPACRAVVAKKHKRKKPVKKKRQLI